VDFRGRTYEVQRCGNCGMGKTMPFPSDEELEELYSASNYRDKDKGKRFIPPMEWLVGLLRNRRLRAIERFIKKGTILDIGCGRGLLLKAARESGWEVYATEHNKDSASHAADILGIDVRSDDIRNAGFESGSFDVISLWHVLEHLQDPQGVIEKCHDLLKPGGLLVIAVPNFASLQAIVSGRHWFHLDVPYHLYHFKLHSLEKLIGRSGFRIKKVSHFSTEYNPYGFLQSMLNMCGISNNFLYNVLRAGRSAPASGGKGYMLNLLLTAVLTPVFIPVSLILSTIESMLSMGGTVQIFSTRETR